MKTIFKESLSINYKELPIEVYFLGLTAEAGEVATEYQRFLWGRQNYKETRENLISELGDVLYYHCMIAKEYDITIEEIVKTNITKRKNREAK